MVIDANNDLEEIQVVFSEHARMIVEEARKKLMILGHTKLHSSQRSLDIEIESSWAWFRN